MLILLASLAFAQEEPQIISVPEGSTLQRPAIAEGFQIDYQAYLLPEGHYDSCLVSAKNLPICKQSLDYCQEQSAWALAEARSTFQLARDQFQADEDQVAALTQQVVELDADLARTTGKLRQARTQRNVAWAITGGLVLGAVAVTAVAIGN